MKNLNEKTPDQIEEERMFAPRQFTHQSYHRLVNEKSKRLYQKHGYKDHLDFNGNTYATTTDVRLAIIYQMLGHIMYKLAATEYDANTHGFFQHNWDQINDLLEP
ncbi:MAG: hypothetical protein KIT62_07750 [Cyclobacteriaceae bacterium]|nr:hypothetical protein [Cyclobacteriaceae bacterium]